MRIYGSSDLERRKTTTTTTTTTTSTTTLPLLPRLPLIKEFAAEELTEFCEKVALDLSMPDEITGSEIRPLVGSLTPAEA